MSLTHGTFEVTKEFINKNSAILLITWAWHTLSRAQLRHCRSPHRSSTWPTALEFRHSQLIQSRFHRSTHLYGLSELGSSTLSHSKSFPKLRSGCKIFKCSFRLFYPPKIPKSKRRAITFGSSQICCKGLVWRQRHKQGLATLFAL
jgi:hypothetical protein